MPKAVHEKADSDSVAIGFFVRRLEFDLNGDGKNT